MPFKLFWVNISQALQILFILFWLEFILEVSQQKEKIPPFVRRCWYGLVEGEDALLVYADSQVIEYQEAYYIPEYL